MAETEEFAHGSVYGDYSGVVFYGATRGGCSLDRLAVSDSYIDPLFRAVLDRSWRDSGGERVPRLASEWNTQEGWSACAAGRTPVSQQDIEELVTAFTQVTSPDLAPHCAGSTREDCLRCAVVIKEFVANQLSRDAILFMEDD